MTTNDLLTIGKIRARCQVRLAKQRLNVLEGKCKDPQLRSTSMPSAIQDLEVLLDIIERSLHDQGTLPR